MTQKVNLTPAEIDELQSIIDEQRKREKRDAMINMETLNAIAQHWGGVHVEPDARLHVGSADGGNPLGAAEAPGLCSIRLLSVSFGTGQAGGTCANAVPRTGLRMFQRVSEKYARHPLRQAQGRLARGKAGPRWPCDSWARCPCYGKPTSHTPSKVGRGVRGCQHQGPSELNPGSAAKSDEVTNHPRPCAARGSQAETRSRTFRFR